MGPKVSRAEVAGCVNGCISLHSGCSHKPCAMIRDQRFLPKASPKPKGGACLDFPRQASASSCLDQGSCDSRSLAVPPGSIALTHKAPRVDLLSLSYRCSCSLHALGHFPASPGLGSDHSLPLPALLPLGHQSWPFCHGPVPWLWVDSRSRGNCCFYSSCIVH